jgi:hypothetical protein
MPEFAEVSYTLTNLIVCRFNITTGDCEGPVVSVDNGQVFVNEPEADVDKMRGYGRYTRGIAVPIGAKITFKAGGLDISGLSVIAGISAGSSGSTPNRRRRMTRAAAGKSLPYFSILGVSATDDDGIAVCGLKAVKLDTQPKYEANGESNKFNVWETAGYSFPQDGILDFFEFYESESDWTAPADAAALNTWFDTVATED